MWESEDEGVDEDTYTERKAAEHAERKRVALAKWKCDPSRWLRVLDYTEGAAAGRLPVRRLGGNGTGDGNDQFGDPRGVTIDPSEDGNVYVADRHNHRVQVFTKAGVYVRTIGGNGAGDGIDQLWNPEGVAVESDLVFVADTGNHRVQVFTKAGAYVRTIGGNGQGEGSNQFEMDPTADVAVESGKDGHVYVVDSFGDSGHGHVHVFLKA